jgi:hypothetical protein
MLFQVFILRLSNGKTQGFSWNTQIQTDKKSLKIEQYLNILNHAEGLLQPAVKAGRQE